MIDNLPDFVIEYICEYFLGIDVYNLRITNICNINKIDVLNKYLHFWNKLPLNMMLLKIANIAKKIDKCKLIFIEDYQNMYNGFSIKYAKLQRLQNFQVYFKLSAILNENRIRSIIKILH